MTLRLTPDAIAACYDFLRLTAPFNKLKLPESDDLEFRVTRHKDRFGHFDDRDGKAPWKNIAISEIFVKSCPDLTATLSHEMCHVALHVGGDPNWDKHGQAFKSLARRVCKVHGFSFDTF